MSENGSGALIATVEEMLLRGESRSRALRAIDLESRRATISSFLANLSVAALNQINHERFVAIRFGRSDYSGKGVYSGLSYKAAILIRDCFLAAGWIEGSGGGDRLDYLEERYGWLSRYRATEALTEVLERFGCDWTMIRCPRTELIVKRGTWSTPEPEEIKRSREVLKRVNSQLSNAELSLPSAQWTVARKDRASTKARRKDGDMLAWDGDLTARTLYRSFRKTWERGGRLYGGWWINIPKSARAAITINGEEVVELDYNQLHPRILYSRLGIPLSSDIYTVTGFSRELGKDVFMRLLNGKTLSLRTPADAPFPQGGSFAQYLESFKSNVRPILRFLGNDEGAKLQREDSDLAVDILNNLEGQGIVALPVHDSFIVTRRHRQALHDIMLRCFVDRFGVSPVISG